MTDNDSAPRGGGHGGAADPPAGRGGFVVVGVVPGQAREVVTTAARFAVRFSAELICAHVDQASYAVERPDGSVESLPIDPDLAPESEDRFDVALTRDIAEALEESGLGGSDSAAAGLRWSTRFLAGDPARALAALADSVDAEMIVVGTRDATVRASIAEFFGGSVAVHLAHRQHRPVVVVPLEPLAAGSALPWEEAR
jgi:nucleotide-binding universal stress UspA family protein